MAVSGFCFFKASTHALTCRGVICRGVVAWVNFTRWLMAAFRNLRVLSVSSRSRCMTARYRSRSAGHSCIWARIWVLARCWTSRALTMATASSWVSKDCRCWLRLGLG